MRRLLAMAIIPLAGASAAADPAMRAPSCEALIAFAVAARPDRIEVSFGKKAEQMSVDEFDRAIATVASCADEVRNRPPDHPSMFPRERKPMQLSSLMILGEDLRFYRSLEQERERRAARNKE
jgi:hypothetical protein